VSILDSYGPAGPPAAVASTAAALRRHRQELLQEHGHCVYLRRLLRARLDLTVAEIVELPSLMRPWLSARPLPSTVSLLVLAVLAGDPAQDPSSQDHGSQDHGGDLVARLRALQLAIRQLGDRCAMLQTEIDDATALFVEALVANPGSSLDRAAPAAPFAASPAVA